MDDPKFEAVSDRKQSVDAATAAAAETGADTDSCSPSWRQGEDGGGGACGQSPNPTESSGSVAQTPSDRLVKKTNLRKKSSVSAGGTPACPEHGAVPNAERDAQQTATALATASKQKSVIRWAGADSDEQAVQVEVRTIFVERISRTCAARSKSKAASKRKAKFKAGVKSAEALTAGSTLGLAATANASGPDASTESKVPPLSSTSSSFEKGKTTDDSTGEASDGSVRTCVMAATVATTTATEAAEGRSVVIRPRANWNETVRDLLRSQWPNLLKPSDEAAAASAFAKSWHDRQLMPGATTEKDGDKKPELRSPTAADATKAATAIASMWRVRRALAERHASGGARRAEAAVWVEKAGKTAARRVTTEDRRDRKEAGESKNSADADGDVDGGSSSASGSAEAARDDASGGSKRCPDAAAAATAAEEDDGGTSSASGSAKAAREDASGGSNRCPDTAAARTAAEEDDGGSSYASGSAEAARDDASGGNKRCPDTAAAGTAAEEDDAAAAKSIEAIVRPEPLSGSAGRESDSRQELTCELDVAAAKSMASEKRHQSESRVIVSSEAESEGSVLAGSERQPRKDDPVVPSDGADDQREGGGRRPASARATEGVDERSRSKHQNGKNPAASPGGGRSQRGVDQAMKKSKLAADASRAELPNSADGGAAAAAAAPEDASSSLVGASSDAQRVELPAQIAPASDANCAAVEARPESSHVARVASNAEVATSSSDEREDEELAASAKAKGVRDVQSQQDSFDIASRAADAEGNPPRQAATSEAAVAADSASQTKAQTVSSSRTKISKRSSSSSIRAAELVAAAAPAVRECVAAPTGIADQSAVPVVPAADSPKERTYGGGSGCSNTSVPASAAAASTEPADETPAGDIVTQTTKSGASSVTGLTADKQRDEARTAVGVEVATDNAAPTVLAVAVTGVTQIVAPATGAAATPAATVASRAVPSPEPIVAAMAPLSAPVPVSDTMAAKPVIEATATVPIAAAGPPISAPGVASLAATAKQVLTGAAAAPLATPVSRSTTATPARAATASASIAAATIPGIAATAPVAAAMAAKTTTTAATSTAVTVAVGALRASAPAMKASGAAPAMTAAFSVASKGPSVGAHRASLAAISLNRHPSEARSYGQDEDEEEEEEEEDEEEEEREEDEDDPKDERYPNAVFDDEEESEESEAEEDEAEDEERGEEEDEEEADADEDYYFDTVIGGQTIRAIRLKGSGSQNARWIAVPPLAVLSSLDDSDAATVASNSDREEESTQ